MFVTCGSDRSLNLSGFRFHCDTHFYCIYDPEMIELMCLLNADLSGFSMVGFSTVKLNLS